MGSKLANRVDKYVRHVPSVRAVFSQVAVLVLGRLEMAAGGFESASRIAGSSFMDVESVLSLRNVRDIDVDQDTTRCLCESGVANLLTLGIEERRRCLRGRLSETCGRRANKAKTQS